MSLQDPHPAAFVRFDAKPLAAALGAEIRGLDLSQPLATQAARELEIALAHYGVLVFRDPRLTPRRHIARGNRLTPQDRAKKRFSGRFSPRLSRKVGPSYSRRNSPRRCNSGTILVTKSSSPSGR